MLTVQQVADEFKLDKRTVYRKINLGEIKAVRIGKTLRIEQSEIDRIKRGETITKA